MIALFGWWSVIPAALVVIGVVIASLSEKPLKPATGEEKLLGFLSLMWLFRHR